MKSLPIGISDYKKIIEEQYYYVDKTLFVNELLSNADEVTLICRPRRFGKTINLSMLKYFFEKTPKSNQHLFVDKKVWQHEDIRKHQGQYPVIFITFKKVKETTFELAYDKFKLLIADEFDRYATVLSDLLGDYDRQRFENIIKRTASRAEYDESLSFLSKILEKHYQKKVIVLLDEYDTPIHSAYANGYYAEMVDFIKAFFGGVLKDNTSLERGVLTGILRTAKEGIFSDLNNLEVCTFLYKKYEDKFGFTQHEVEQLLQDKNIECHANDIKQWYNGYHSGDATLVYNPWSILKCAENDGRLMTYWVSTSSNDLVKDLLARANDTAKKELEDVLNGIPIIKTIDEGFTFQEMYNNENALWSLLFFSGYMTYDHRDLGNKGKYVCSLVPPNNEIRVLYTELIERIFSESLLYRTSESDALLHALITGDCMLFQDLLQEFIINCMSFYDLPKNQPERGYHLFVLGLLVSLKQQYAIRSNRESGYGRYDIMLIPNDPNNSKTPGIIIEFKRATRQTIEEAAQAALNQIHEKNYVAELRAQGINNVIVYGIAFEGKCVLVRMA